HHRPRRSPGNRELRRPACINDGRQIRTHKGLLRRRGLVTQRLPGAPPRLQTIAKSQVTSSSKPARLKYVVLGRDADGHINGFRCQGGVLDLQEPLAKGCLPFWTDIGTGDLSGELQG